MVLPSPQIPHWACPDSSQRGALAFASGNVYVPFGGRNGDCTPYSAWIVGAPASGPGGMFSAGPLSPAQNGGGMWAASGLGVDGSASNDASNLMQEVRAAFLLQRARYGVGKVSHKDALRWATKGSAACVGRPELGEIALGKAADLALGIFGLRGVFRSRPRHSQRGRELLKTKIA